ncbi:MAG: hypothetical protein ACLFNS_04080 [Desulfobacterales bacterium]
MVKYVINNQLKQKNSENVRSGKELKAMGAGLDSNNRLTFCSVSSAGI